MHGPFHGFGWPVSFVDGDVQDVLLLVSRIAALLAPRPLSSVEQAALEVIFVDIVHALEVCFFVVCDLAWP